MIQVNIQLDGQETEKRFENKPHLWRSSQSIIQLQYAITGSIVNGIKA